MSRWMCGAKVPVTDRSMCDELRQRLRIRDTISDAAGKDAMDIIQERTRFG